MCPALPLTVGDLREYLADLDDAQLVRVGDLPVIGTNWFADTPEIVYLALGH